MDSEDQVVTTCTLSDLVKVAESVDDSLLPKKSKQRYERMYNEFEGWRKRNGAGALSEHTLLAYFSTLGESNKPTTLWAYYSMLKSTLNVNDGVDISTYKTLLSFLKQQSEGYRPKKTKAFTEDEMRSFISSAPDTEWLVVKVVCIFGLCGGLRIDEIGNINSSDVKMYDDLAYVKITDSKSKEPRSFTVTGSYFETVKKYWELRPLKVLTDRFFLSYANGKCTGHVIGKKKFSKMPSQIATYLKLEDADKYTGHSFRRASAAVVGNSSATINTLKRHGGWKINVKTKKPKSNSEKDDSDDSTSDSIATTENAENDESLTDQLNPTIIFDEEEVYIDASDFQCGDVSITSRGRTNVIEIPKSNGNGQISTAPFHFTNCRVTFNYYQK